MSEHCWTVYTGNLDHPQVYVLAADEVGALDQHAGLRAERTFPWLGDTFEDVDPDSVEDGARGNPNGTGHAHPRTAEVQAWLATYAGRNTFVLDVQAKQRATVSGSKHTRKRPRLSFKQVDALAKAKDREEQWAKEREKARLGTGLDLRSTLPFGTTYAAAVNEDGGVSFVRMDNVKQGKWAGWVFVKSVIGGVAGMDNGQRLGAQRPGEADYAGTWAKVIETIIADVPAAVRLFGTELGVCGVCGAVLTNDESRAEGIGPVCKAKLDSHETIAPDTSEGD